MNVSALSLQFDPLVGNDSTLAGTLHKETLTVDKSCILLGASCDSLLELLKQSKKAKEMTEGTLLCKAAFAGTVAMLLKMTSEGGSQMVDYKGPLEVAFYFLLSYQRAQFEDSKIGKYSQPILHAVSFIEDELDALRENNAKKRHGRFNIKDDAESTTTSGTVGRSYSRRVKEQQNAEFATAVLRQSQSGMKVVFSERKGRGVVATKPFAKGDFVVEYRGTLLDRSSAKQLERQYAQSSRGCYTFHFRYKDRPYVIDATLQSPWLGRLINHSKKKSNLKILIIELHGRPRLILTASCLIQIGEELLYDYGDRAGDSVAAFPWLRT